MEGITTTSSVGKKETRHCSHCKQDKPLSGFHKGNCGDGLASWCKTCTLASVRQWQRNHPDYNWKKLNPEKARASWKKSYEKRMPEFNIFHWAKHRAKIEGLPFSISLSDVVVPKFCPILGIKLERGKGKCQPGSPTLDRLVPERGYVPGNISVVSLKANNIKSDGTIAELEAVLLWMKKELNQCTISQPSI